MVKMGMPGALNSPSLKCGIMTTTTKKGRGIICLLVLPDFLLFTYSLVLSDVAKVKFAVQLLCADSNWLIEHIVLGILLREVFEIVQDEGLVVELCGGGLSHWLLLLLLVLLLWRVLIPAVLWLLACLRLLLHDELRMLKAATVFIFKIYLYSNSYFSRLSCH
jgi:hypothetical protein